MRRRPTRLPVTPAPSACAPRGERLDIHSMFADLNMRFFDNELAGVYVEYSAKMTLCAGTCTYLGGSGGCRIGLSEPILTRRPPHDTRDTLLHEMIHARLFLRYGLTVRDGPDGHGPRFLAEAQRLNEVACANITVFHNFRDEVDVSRGHWWQCQGQCGRIIKRAMNRPPRSGDPWWPEHEQTCGGKFSKTHEPTPREPPPKLGALGIDVSANADTSMNPSQANSRNGRPVVLTHRIDKMMQSIGGGSKAQTKSHQRPRPTQRPACPVCGKLFPSEHTVSAHLDGCLLRASAAERPHDSRPGASAPNAKRPRTEVPAPNGRGDEVIDVDVDGEPAHHSRWTRGLQVTTGRVAATDEHSKPSYPGGLKALQGRSVPVARERPLAVRPGASMPRHCSDGDDRSAENGQPAGSYFAIDQEAVFAKERFKVLCERLGGSDLLDFALGNESTLPSDAQSLAEAARDHPETVQDLPKFTIKFRRKSHVERLHSLAQALGLWPSTDCCTPIFADGAARSALPPAEFFANALHGATLNEHTWSLSSHGESVLRGESPSAVTHAERHHASVFNESGRATRKRQPPTELEPTECTRSPRASLQHATRERASRDRARWPITSHSPNGGQPVVGEFGRGSRSEAGHCGGSAGLQQAGDAGTRDESSKVLELREPDKTAMGTCPLCSAAVPKAEMDTHLSECLEDANCFTQPQVDAGSATVSRAGPTTCASRPTAGVTACPLCGLSVLQRDLEAHTKRCLDEQGLLDAF